MGLVLQLNLNLATARKAKTEVESYPLFMWVTHSSFAPLPLFFGHTGQNSRRVRRGSVEPQQRLSRVEVGVEARPPQGPLEVCGDTVPRTMGACGQHPVGQGRECRRQTMFQTGRHNKEVLRQHAHGASTTKTRLNWSETLTGQIKIFSLKSSQEGSL